MRCENLFERCEVLKNGVGKFCSAAEQSGKIIEWRGAPKGGVENLGAVRSAEDINITHSNF